MGSIGSGKALVGAAVAAGVRARFIDGDDLHRAALRGRPDGGDELWPEAIGVLLAGERGAIVIACPPLPRAARDRIRVARPDAVFVKLVDEDAVAQPLAQDEAGVRVANGPDLAAVADSVLTQLAGRARIARRGPEGQSLR